MIGKMGAKHFWLYIPIFAISAWLGTIVAESSLASRDLHAYIILCQSTQSKNCVEIKAKADEALQLAEDPEVKILASMISDTMRLYIEADVASVEDSHSLAGIVKCLVTGLMDHKLSMKAALLLAKKTWYHDLSQKLDIHYQRLRILSDFTGGLIFGLAGVALWIMAARSNYRNTGDLAEKPKPRCEELPVITEAQPTNDLDRF